MFRLLRANEIECRVSQIKKNGLVLLLYKNARTDMDILDETVGPMNWQRRHCRDNANCIVSIWDDTKKCWIEKEDTGTESNTEAQKGLASDSFKRACFNVGIGRELYTAPFVWVTSANCEIKENNGRLQCFDRFDVSEIGYNDNREINRLRIVNARTGNVVYSYDDDSAPKPETKTMVVECERCGKPITGAVLADGTTATASQIIAKSKLAFGGVYCATCMEALNEKKPQEAPKKRETKMATAEQKQYIIDHANDDDYQKIMGKYGAEFEKLTEAMATKVIAQIDNNNRAAG